MELRQLRYAVRLGETGHFGRAAELEYISQPSFSQQIQRLERELGVQLFERGARGVTPTPAGAAFIRRAEEILRESQDMRAEARSIASGARERLRVGVLPGTIHELVPIIVEAFRESRPDVALEFVDVTFDSQVSTILDGIADLAFLAMPFQVEALGCDALFAEPRCVGLPAGHPKAQATSLGVEDILDLPFIAASDVAPRPWTEFWRCDEERGGPIRPVVTTSSVTQGLMAIVHYGAVDTGPSSSFRQCMYPGVVGVPLHDGPYSCAVLARRRDDRRSSVADFRTAAVRVARARYRVVAAAVAPEAAPAGTPLPAD